MLFHGDPIVVETKWGLLLSKLGESEPPDTTVLLLELPAVIAALVKRLTSNPEVPTTTV